MNHELSHFVTKLFANRFDAFGTCPEQGSPYTVKESTPQEWEEHLLQHLEGRGRVVSQLEKDQNGETLWAALDFDNHRSDDETAAANLVGIQRAKAIAEARGFATIAVDSDGRGGFHLWLLFGVPVSAIFAKNLVLNIRDMLEMPEVEIRPESRIESQFGKSLTLPLGRHKSGSGHYRSILRSLPCGSLVAVHPEDELGFFVDLDQGFAEGRYVTDEWIETSLAHRVHRIRKPKPRVEPTPELNSKRITAYRDRLDFGQGSRNQSFFSFASFALDLGEDEQSVEIMCESLNETLPDPLPSHELAATVKSASRQPRRDRS